MGRAVLLPEVLLLVQNLRPLSPPCVADGVAVSRLLPLLRLLRRRLLLPCLPLVTPLVAASLPRARSVSACARSSGPQACGGRHSQRQPQQEDQMLRRRPLLQGAWQCLLPLLRLTGLLPLPVIARCFLRVVHLRPCEHSRQAGAHSLVQRLSQVHQQRQQHHHQQEQQQQLWLKICEILPCQSPFPSPPHLQAWS